MVNGVWRPRSTGQAEQPNLPRCVRCSVRTGQSTPIEAYWVADEGDGRVDIAGRCRNVCDHPGDKELNPRDGDVDVVRITWATYSDARTKEMLARDLPKQIAAIRFFDDLQSLEAAA